MSVLSTSRLPPPRDLVNDTEQTVIVSMKRPLCIYFDRIMELAQKRILGAVAGGKSREVIELRIVGCGGSISRCKQIGRYAQRAIKENFKHMISSVDRSTAVHAGQVEILEYNVQHGADPDVVECSPTVKNIDSVEITITVTLQ